jgi:hypothetical protein
MTRDVELNDAPNDLDLEVGLKHSLSKLQRPSTPLLKRFRLPLFIFIAAFVIISIMLVLSSFILKTPAHQIPTFIEPVKTADTLGKSKIEPVDHEERLEKQSVHVSDAEEGDDAKFIAHMFKKDKSDAKSAYERAEAESSDEKKEQEAFMTQEQAGGKAVKELKQKKQKKSKTKKAK